MIHNPTAMTESAPRQKRVAQEANSGINGLIAACNSNDRFKLLEDDSVLPSNLDNPVHPIFSGLSCKGPMKQMLQLASHFLTHDTVLTFFVPLLYGRELTSVAGDIYKTYLSDPLANSSTERYKNYLSGVREALNCLSHSVLFEFRPPAKRVYARTLLDDARPCHGPSCCPAFQRRYSCKIELANYFRNYYASGEYVSASRCAQFRHDFLFAATLVHEIVHAVGVLRRGNLNEPHIRPDCPETEWGYGWEHFMFGSVINPQDRTGTGTHLLMRKVWADQKTTIVAGGKEYSDVPMTYIAQWFRKETWDIIRLQGPTAIAAPVVHFKIQSSNKLGAWVVLSDDPAIKKDLIELRAQWKECAKISSLVLSSLPTQNGRVRCSRILWRPVSTKQLQKDNVTIPARTQQVSRLSQLHGQSRPKAGVVCCQRTQRVLTCERKRMIHENWDILDHYNPRKRCRELSGGIQ